MKTILIAEDDSGVRENIEQILKYEGYNVISAENGTKAFTMALNNEPDLILSDIRMPEMDGMQLLQELQNNDRTFSIPFIFLTAKMEIENIREGMNKGADDYITKPFQIDDIVKSINARFKKFDLRQNFIKDFSKFMTKKIPHELRTPLVGIMGMSEILLENFKDLSEQDINEMVGDIRSSGKKLHRRVEKFIEYAELFDGNEEKASNLNVCEYELNPQRLSRLLKYSANEFNRKEDLHISFEPAKLKISNKFYDLAISELLENSMKFTSVNKSINITGTKNGNSYITKIADYGNDIKNLEIDSIGVIGRIKFNNNFEEGFGLGLILVKKITELFHGDLKFERTDGLQNIFEFSIPLVES
jgi:two-component system, sensor histidine kinase and response regulator